MKTRTGIINIIVLLSIILSGCGSHVWHYVHKGDTLYSVSFRYGQDYKQVAKWNHIPPPYIIAPGQRLRVSSPSTPEIVQGNRAPTVPEHLQAKSRSTSARVNSSQLPAAGIETHTDKGRLAQSKPILGNGTRVAPLVRYPEKVTWSWPVRGKIIQPFTTKEPGLKGIDIAGHKGGAIRAAASGRVVYAGEGLPSYGRLIIIKHNDQFLSAYAHNRKLLVKEGQFVTAGSVIAEMGDSGTDRVKLHFEVRKRGRPVNPLSYLPKH